MYPALLSSAAARAGPASSRSCAATTTLSRGAERGDEARGGRDVVGDLGAPSEECGCVAERRRDRSAAHDDELRHGPEDRGDAVVADRRLAGCVRFEQLGSGDVAVVEVGDEADRSPVEQLAPEIWRKIVCADGDDASGAAAGEPSDERVDVADGDVDEAVADRNLDEGAGEERTDPASPRRDCDGVGEIAIGEVVRRDDPRDVDFRAGAQACHDAQRDVVHGLSLRASCPKHVAQHHARLRVLPRLGRSIECESGVLRDAS